MPTRKTREELDAEMNELNKQTDDRSPGVESNTSAESESHAQSAELEQFDEQERETSEESSDEVDRQASDESDESNEDGKDEPDIEQMSEPKEEAEVHIDGFLENRLKVALESLLFAASEPVSVKRLTEVLREFHPEVNIRLVRKLLSELKKDLRESARGVRIAEVANSYQLRTPSETAQYVKKMVMTRPPRLTRATLETLAIVAYRQPITRPEVEDIRGVDCGAVLRHLLEKKLIKILGRKDEPGRPLLYATTSEFLVFFGLKDLKSLPTLKDFVELTDEHKAQLGLDPSKSEESKSEAEIPKTGFEGLIDDPGDSYSPVGTDEVITELAEALDELRSKNKNLSKSDVLPSNKSEAPESETPNENQGALKEPASKDDEHVHSSSEETLGEADDG